MHWASLLCGSESGLTGPAKMECRAVAAWASPESCPPVTSCFPLLWVLKLCLKPRRRPTLTSRASQFRYQGPKAAATGSWVGLRDHKSRLVSVLLFLHQIGLFSCPTQCGGTFQSLVPTHRGCLPGIVCGTLPPWVPDVLSSPS